MSVVTAENLEVGTNSTSHHPELKKRPSASTEELENIVKKSKSQEVSTADEGDVLNANSAEIETADDVENSDSNNDANDNSISNNEDSDSGSIKDSNEVGENQANSSQTLKKTSNSNSQQSEKNMVSNSQNNSEVPDLSNSVSDNQPSDDISLTTRVAAANFSECVNYNQEFEKIEKINHFMEAELLMLNEDIKNSQLEISKFFQVFNRKVSNMTEKVTEMTRSIYDWVVKETAF